MTTSQVGGVPNQNFKLGEPTLNRWLTSHHIREDVQSSLIAYRECLDNMTESMVEWQPLNASCQFQEIT